MSSMVSDPVLKNGIAGNLGLTELLSIAGVGYASYRALTEHKDNLTTLLTVIPGILMANSALAAKTDFTSGSAGTYSFGNFDVFELATAGSLVWAGLRFLNLHADTVAAVGCWMSAASVLFFSGKGNETYL